MKTLLFSLLFCLGLGTVGLMAQTTAPAQLKGLDTWKTTPVFTIGESFNNYTPVGIPDGVGAVKRDATTVRLYVNHELGATAGYAYQLANGTSLNGARMSYFDVDINSRSVKGAGLAYDKIVDRAGAVVSSATQVNEGSSTTAGFDRFCSASFFKGGTYNL
ncbi:MAG: PEP-CTERM sorting domain-containing protein, partial [Bacteroidetes bacterium]|nr:PEP-CTERM sorting domain-containing protein [Bacteroidota bacterium]